MRPPLECAMFYVYLCHWHTSRTEADEELDILNADVFPGIQSANSCLHFSVERIEFDLPGTILLYVLENA